MTDRIFGYILKVYEECDVIDFPIKCEKILSHYGYRLYTYNEIYRKNPELYNMCVSYSDDAFLDRNTKTVAYNNNKPKGRIRFSLMHELGHCMLNHESDTPHNEQEANCFASNILAPRIAIYYAKCKNAADVKNVFGLSLAASEYAFMDYCSWHKNVIANNRRISHWDKKIYEHFYSSLRGKFVWRRSTCVSCGISMYNTLDSKCSKCMPGLIKDDTNDFLMSKYFDDSTFWADNINTQDMENWVMNRRIKAWL